MKNDLYGCHFPRACLVDSKRICLFELWHFASTIQLIYHKEMLIFYFFAKMDWSVWPLYGVEPFSEHGDSWWSSRRPSFLRLPLVNACLYK